jgi:hypothetical protein
LEIHEIVTLLVQRDEPWKLSAILFLEHYRAFDEQLFTGSGRIQIPFEIVITASK